jgi:hypothetical protein
MASKLDSSTSVGRNILHAMPTGCFQSTMEYCGYREWTRLQSTSKPMFQMCQDAFRGVLGEKHTHEYGDLVAFRQVLRLTFDEVLTSSPIRTLDLARIMVNAKNEKVVLERYLQIFKPGLSKLCPSLTALDFGSIGISTTNLLTQVLIHAPSTLKSLSFLHPYSDYIDFSDASIQTLTKMFPSLTSLELPICLGRSNSDAAIDSILTNCTDLTSLDISMYSGLTERTAQLIAEKGSRLMCLDITSSSDRSLPAESVNNIVISCRSLTELHAWNHKVDDGTLETIASCLPSLRTLDFSECSLITDVGLRHLARCTNLRDFELSDNSQVTFKGVSDLIHSRPTWERFSCYKCEQVPHAELRKLKQEKGLVRI